MPEESRSELENALVASLDDPTSEVQNLREGLDGLRLSVGQGSLPLEADGIRWPRQVRIASLKLLSTLDPEPVRVHAIAQRHSAEVGITGRQKGGTRYVATQDCATGAQK